MISFLVRSLVIATLLNGSLALAQTPQAVSVTPEAQPATLPVATDQEPTTPKPFKKNLFFASTAVNLYTFAGATETKESQSLTISDRVVLLQLVGFGYFPTKHIRAHLSFQFAETVSGPFPGDNRFTLAAAIPWVAYTTGRFYTGAGPLLASRAGGTPKQDIGIFTSHGAAFQLGHGVSLTGALVVPMMFGQRFSIGVSPSVGLAYRF